MLIKNLPRYTLICDICKKSQGYNGGKSFTRWKSTKLDKWMWRNYGKYHYCPECARKMEEEKCRKSR